jgi:hypothetical protein
MGRDVNEFNPNDEVEQNAQQEIKQIAMILQQKLSIKQ